MTPMTSPPNEPILRVGRYVLFDKLAAGGMATVHIGRLLGPAGFARTVAIKRLHASLAQDESFVTMFLDEARVAARLRHPNVVAIHDVVQTDDELFLVMDYVEGESLSSLLKLGRNRGAPIPIEIGCAIIASALRGLQAAHDVTGDDGKRLNLVHRDVSPQNILVGVNGVARILDFGIAKAAGRAQTTLEGQIKGKLPYMALEQLGGGEVDHRVDIYSAGVVLWEVLAGKPRLRAPSRQALLAVAMNAEPTPPSEHRPDVTPELDAIVMRALHRDSAQRFQTAREFALALEAATPLASAATIGNFVATMAADALSWRSAVVASVETHQHNSTTQLWTDEDGPLPPSPDASEVTTGSDSAMREPSRNRRLGAAALALIIGGLGAILMYTGDEAEDPPATSTDPTATQQTPTALVETTTVDAPPQPTAAPTTSSVSPPAATSNTPPPSWPKHKGTTEPPPEPTTKPEAVKPNCNPPYTVDASGIQRVKIECL